MSKRNFYDDDDKSCLVQVLSLLNNLEALSHDQEITSNDLSLDFNMVSRPLNFLTVILFFFFKFFSEISVKITTIRLQQC